VRRKPVIVELLPNRIDVVAFDGMSRVAEARIPIETEADAAGWVKSLRVAGRALRRIVEEHDLRDRQATVLYRSPTNAISLDSIGVRSPSEALGAATLARLDALPYPAAAAICDGAVIGRDGTGSDRRTHVLVVAERDDVAGAIVQMIESAGLHFQSAVPIDATILSRLTTDMLGNRGSRQGTIFIGEHSSFFFIGEEQALLFDRRIGIGYEALVTSLTRPIRSSTSDTPLELDGDAATAMLFRHGFPAWDTVVDEERGITGQSILPLMQPVLQRCVVELRQSLRFGVSDDKRSGFPVRICGPGARIPGLAAIIANELDIELMGSENSGPYDYLRPCAPDSALDTALGDRTVLSYVNIQPNALELKRRAGRLRQWLWTGAAAALAVIGLDAVRFQGRLSDTRDKVDALSARFTNYESLRLTHDRLHAALDAMEEYEQTVAVELGSRPPYRSFMNELSHLTPKAIRYISISSNRDANRWRGQVSGYVFVDQTSMSGDQEISALVDAFRASPLFANVSLGNVQTGSPSEVAGRRFHVNFTLVSTPSDAFQAAATREGGDG
jgi:Tfp pilus assembly PilM family ATPase